MSIHGTQTGVCVIVALWARESTGGRTQAQISSSGSLNICVYKVPDNADELTLKTTDPESPFASCHLRFSVRKMTK